MGLSTQRAVGLGVAKTREEIWIVPSDPRVIPGPTPIMRNVRPVHESPIV